MGRLGEKKTFVDEVYDEFLNLDYDVTEIVEIQKQKKLQE